jgi:hypothetical protein
VRKEAGIRMGTRSGTRSSRGRIAVLALGVAALALLALTPSASAADHSYIGSFGPDGTEATEFSEPAAIAVDQTTHDIYVADAGAETLYKFDGNHEPANFTSLGTNKIEGLAIYGIFGLGEGQIAVDSTSHTVYVTTIAGFAFSPNTLQAFDGETGEPANFTASSAEAAPFTISANKIEGFEELIGVAVDQNGDIYANDYTSFFGGTGMSVFAPSGERITTSFGLGETANLAVDSNGNVYTNYFEFEVYWYAPSAFPVVPATEWAEEGTVNSATSYSVAVDPATDDVYVAEYSPASRVARFEPEGGSEVEELGASGEGELHGPQGVGVDGGLGLSGRVYASDSEGAEPRVKVYASPNGAPAVTTGNSTEVNYYLRSLEGEVNPEGFVEDCHFEYGTTTAYGTTVPCSPSAAELKGDSFVPVSAETEPLEPNTTYHYRLVASNGAGASQGADATFTTGPAPVGGCPNEARRQEQGIAALLLPGCMALEQVSPPQKDGQPAKEPIVSADGDRVAFASAASLGGSPLLGPGSDFYVADRGAAAWATAPTAPQSGQFRGGWSSYAPVTSFSPDLAAWFNFLGTPQQSDRGTGQIYTGALGQPYAPLSPPLAPNVPPGPGESASEPLTSANFAGFSADHSRAYVIPGINSTAYLPGDPEPSGTGADPNLYAAHLDAAGQPAAELVARDRDAKAWGAECGARLGGIASILGGASAKNGFRNQGAVSADGSRVYFSTRAAQPAGEPCDAANKLRILERLETSEGPWIGPLFGSECARVSPPCSSADGNDLYQGASSDQTRVYFTTNRQLADSDLDEGGECSNTAAVVGCDLYLYDASRPAGERLVQVSAGEDVGGGAVHEEGKDAKVYNSIAAISVDGSHVYFAAQGVLTADENPAEESAQEGEPNLYLWDADAESLSFLAVLDPEDGGNGVDEGNLWGGEGSFRNLAYPVPLRGAGDGHVLVFDTRASLSERDADEGYLDIYRYDTAADTPPQCVSCVGEHDKGEFDARKGAPPIEIEGLDTGFAEKFRWASEEGRSVLFKTAERLLPGDVNGVRDSYLWRDGQIYRLPGTADPVNKLFDNPTLSLDGSEVAFQTFARLLPTDRDQQKDVYVARVNGGFPNPAEPELCDPLTEGSCNGPPAAAPAAPNAASQTASGANVKPKRGCGAPARKAKKLSNRAKKLRRHAKQAKRNGKSGLAKQRGKKAARLAKRARSKSKAAKRCRRANRRAAR